MILMDDERFSFYCALDGVHLDGLIGSCGILRFDWPERKTFIQHYFGISGAHNVSLSPDGSLGLLGNFSQQIVLLDLRRAEKMQIVARQSTMHIEECPYRLRANTHHLWYPDNETFLGAVGDNIYRFHIDQLRQPENLGPHRLENAHELRWDPTRRYVLIGDLGPEDAAARRVAVFDLSHPYPAKRSTVISLPGTVWHCCVHPDKPVGYALTYSFSTEQENYVDWAPAYTREYIFEIDLSTAKISRVWSCGSEFPIHLNSDVGVSHDRLYVASGGSHTVVEIDLDNFDESRVLNCMPPLWLRIFAWRQRWMNLKGAAARRATLTNTHVIAQTLQVTGNRMFDGIYAARVSPGGKYLVTGNRGYNRLAVYERETFKKRYTKVLPSRRDRYRNQPTYKLGWRGHHLGLHHAEVTPR